MQIRKTIAAASLLLATLIVANAQKASVNNSTKIPQPVLLQIIRAEDERRWNDNLKSLLSNEDPKVRKRAALAAGRIGDPNAIPVLADMLLMDRDADVRQMAAFALGEIEAPGGAYALVTVLKDPNKSGRARAIEALGKIIAVMVANASPTPNQNSAKGPVDERLDILKAEVLNALRFEDSRGSQADRQTILLGLTAVLRSRPEGAGGLLVKFLENSDSEIVATALNTMARLRLKEGNERVRQLLNHNDPIVRANAARVIGAAEHKEAFDDVLARALNDSDLRVRVSAIRTLAALKDKRAADPLLEKGMRLLKESTQTNSAADGSRLNEILEIVTTLGRVIPNSNSDKAIEWLKRLRETVTPTSPEVEVAFARVAPQFYMVEVLTGAPTTSLNLRARSQIAFAQGLTELASAKTGQPSLDASIKENGTSAARNALTCVPRKPDRNPPRIKPEAVVTMVAPCQSLQPLAVPGFLRAYAAFKGADLQDFLKPRLAEKDVVIRATAAELLGELPPSEANTRALIDALPRALRDKDLDDAAIAILEALAKQKSTAANDAIKTALDSDVYLIRRRAVALLKANGVGDFSDRIGSIKTKNTDVDYRRAISRIGKKVTATIVTTRGPFTIEFLPEDAPLTVDNFVQLARRGYFNGQTIPRVVPNFVIQAGDPRGDQNGGPGYQIRCEINEVIYERASLGMALSGKDTGGSQWFVTHSPQPHLDGGYTIFGRVIRGMEVVDKIARGDTIRRVVVNER